MGSTKVLVVMGRQLRWRSTLHPFQALQPESYRPRRNELRFQFLSACFCATLCSSGLLQRQVVVATVGQERRGGRHGVLQQLWKRAYCQRGPLSEVRTAAERERARHDPAGSLTWSAEHDPAGSPTGCVRHHPTGSPTGSRLLRPAHEQRRWNVVLRVDTDHRNPVPGPGTLQPRPLCTLPCLPSHLLLRWGHGREH